MYRRTVLKSIGVGAFVTGATGSVTATADDSIRYHNELYGPHFPDPTIHRAGDGTYNGEWVMFYSLEPRP